MEPGGITIRSWHENISRVPATCEGNPDSKVHVTNMGPIWGRHDPDGPHDGPMDFALRGITSHLWIPLTNGQQSGV